MLNPVRRVVQLFIYSNSCTIRPIRMASSAAGSRFDLPQRYRGSTKSVWVEYAQLAAEHKPLNLGQGFPDFFPPEHVTRNMAKVANSESPLLHQYTRSNGHVRLVNVLSKLYSKLLGRPIDPMSEILVTSGAYEALYSTIVGHVDEGDEVIIIEPFFDCYEPMVKGAGGTPRFIALKPKTSGGATTSRDWILDPTELNSIFNSKTKAIILNTPNNPLGKVYTREELTVIADLCKKWNVLCISDEVYEWLVYKPNEHVRIATLPGMWERTITIGSAGKTFSVTGWKTGWAYGPANLLHNLNMVHQNSIYTCCTPIQEALALSFEEEIAQYDSEKCYFFSLAKELLTKRDFMVDFLKEAGLQPVVPEGGYFIMAEFSPLMSKIDTSGEEDKYADFRFTKWMTKNVGIQGIPPSVFSCEAHKPLYENYVRYCFIKQDETLQKAADILRKWK